MALARASGLSLNSILSMGSWKRIQKHKHPKQDLARRVAELEADRRVLLAQLNLQATGSKAGLSGILAR